MTKPFIPLACLAALLSSHALGEQPIQYDYTPPEPGTYQLPVVNLAADGKVLGTNGTPVSLHSLFKDRVVVLSFIYTRCGDPKACMQATGVLSEIQRLTQNQPDLAEKLLLVTLSFDPAYDTPEVMARYGSIASEEPSAEWLFLTTRNRADLQPLLDAYGQRVDARKKSSAMGPYYHPLRVYLVDPQRNIRNIYSYGLLDPRLIVADARTIIINSGPSRSPNALPVPLRSSAARQSAAERH
jgi:cytochrome oxidase Cu insertion factor (SCO1/SenC/PrrC family)